MCGFLVDFQKEKNNLRESAFRIPRNLSSRGPSEAGEFSDDQTTSFFFRLEIKGGPSAMQPIFTSNGMYGFGNGQIFNFSSLANEIFDRNFAQKHKDADLHLAVEFLSQSPEKNWMELDGMFSIVLVDPKTGTIYLGRDKTGEKPLFYQTRKNGISVSSLVEPLVVNSEEKVHLDYETVNHWLNFGLVEPGRTFFQEVQEVQPGSLVVYREGLITNKRYWAWPNRGNDTSDIATIKDILIESLDSRIEKEEKIALSLSSGIDSGAIFGVSRKHHYFDLAILLEYKDKQFDEINSLDLDVLRGILQIDKVIFEDTLSPELIEKVIELMDQPISDMSCIPFFMICERATANHKVMMTGDGGDELFLGYRAYNYEKLANVMWFFSNVLPRKMRRKLLIQVLKKSDSGYLSKRNLTARFIAGSLSPKKNRWATALSSSFALQAFQDSSQSPGIGAMPKGLERYFQDFIFPQIYLQKTDRMSMGQGLESRTPFLARSFVDYGLGLSKRTLRKYGKPHARFLYSDLYRQGGSKKRGLGVPATGVVELLREPNWFLLSRFLRIEVIEHAWRFRKANVGMAQFAWNLYVLNFHLIKWKSMGIELTTYVKRN